MNKKKVKNNPNDRDVPQELLAQYVGDKAKVYLHECLAMANSVDLPYETALGLIHGAMMAVVVATVTVEKDQKSKGKTEKKGKKK